MSKIIEHSNSIKSIGFNNTLQNSINKLKFKGLNKNDLYQLSKKYFIHGSNLMDIMTKELSQRTITFHC